MERVKEGTLYKRLKIKNISFDIFYGYNSETEREKWGPVPVFPDLVKNEVFTETGERIVRADQDICHLYSPKKSVSGENWCNDCKYYSHGEEIIGICRCKNNKLRFGEKY